MADAASLQQQVAESVFEALPDLEEQELVELLGKDEQTEGHKDACAEWA